MNTLSYRARLRAMRMWIHCCCLALACLATATSALAQNPAVVGQWGPLMPWPSVSIHTHVLNTGQILFWDYVDAPRKWNPLTGTFGLLPLAGHNPFCSGHVFLADGRLFVAGGHVVPGEGMRNAAIYDPFLNTWTQQALMNNKRWYPTCTLLSNGDVLVLAGNMDNQNGANPLPQVFQVDGTWRNLNNAEMILANYPRTHLAPNGKVFLGGVTSTTRYLDTSGAGSWTTVDNRIVSGRSYGPLVMYDVGKLIYIGGGNPPTATAEVIDLNAASPNWRAVGSMSKARRQVNATVLPDGTVLVTGGSSADGNDNPAGAVYTAELWNPVTEQFTTMSSQSDYRGYHSAAVLLPDGRVLSSGGNDHQTGQVFSPPYLFKGARPVITSAPLTVGYGDSFFVETPDATSVTKVSWIRSSATTHSFNQNGRINFLGFTPSVSVAATGLNVTAPSNPNHCPPGYYLLYILNGNGVPSVARWIQITASSFEFSASDYNVNEAAGPATITINRLGDPVGPVSVDLITSNGTANAGSDYTTVTTKLTFSNGQTSRTVNIPITNDAISESAETVHLILQHALGNAGVGAQSTAALTIEDNDSAPLAEFSASPTSGFVSLDVAFSNLTTGGIANTYLWNFGDGNQSASANPAHTYTSTGDFTVSLTAYSSTGTNTKTKVNFINVTAPPPPVADFSGAPTNGINPLAVAFTDTSTGMITARDWAFGDGDTTNTTATTVEHTYQLAGTYTVNLTVTGPGGSDTKTRTDYIGVANPPPVLQVSPASIDFGQVIVGVTAQATFVVSNAGGSALSGTASIDPGPFAVVLGTPFNLNAGESADVTVSYTPASVGPANGSVMFASDGGDSTNAVSGTGIERTLRVVNTNGISGGTVNVPVELFSLGDENILRFSLAYDTNLLFFADATNAQLSACASAAGAALSVDTNETGDGRLGLEVALPAATTFSQGPCEVAVVTFLVGTVADPTNTPIDFADSPLAREVTDINASPLATVYTNGVITLVPLGADLSITKTVSPDPVDFNQDVTYSITVSNAGPLNATSVVVTDTLPSTVTFVSAVASQGNCLHDSGVVTCALGDVETNAIATITIVATAGVSGVITNVAEVAAAEYEPDPTNNVASAAAVVNTAPQLAVSPSAHDFGAVATGATAQVTLVVTNLGGSALSGTASVTDEPFGIVSGSPFDVPAHGTADVVVRFTPTIEGDASDTVAFTSNGGNAGVPVSGSGAVVADLSITKTVSPDPVDYNQDVTYSITVSNAGPFSATSVVVTDTLPSTVTFVSAVASQGGCVNNSGVVTCELGNVEVNAIATITIVATASASGVITNVAEVAAAEYEPDPANNVASVAAVVNTAPQLAVSPSAHDFGAVAPATTVQVTLVVTNLGGSALSGTASVTDEPFGIVSGSPFNVPGYGTADVIVRFTPTSDGNASDTVAFTSNGGNAGVPVSGSGAVAPVADFTGTPTAGTAPLAVVLADSSSGTITNRLWNFGDGGSTNTVATSMAHTYSAAGTYTVSLTASGPLGSNTKTRANYIVVSNGVPATVTLSASDATAAEPADAGAFTVSRTIPTNITLTVFYAVSGSATMGTDYNNLPGSVTIPVGATSANVIVNPINDNTSECSEKVKLTLSPNAAYVVGTASNATVNVNDEDLPTVTIAATDATAAEPSSNTGKFTVTRAGCNSASRVVSYAVSGTATSGTDYGSLGSSVTIAAGSATATITVKPKDDSKKENTETVIVTLTSKPVYLLGTPKTATVNIQDND